MKPHILIPDRIKAAEQGNYTFSDGFGSGHRASRIREFCDPREEKSGRQSPPTDEKAPKVARRHQCRPRGLTAIHQVCSQADDVGDAAPCGRLPRICLLTETYHPVVGGGEAQARTLAEGLVAAGFGVLVIARRSDALLPLREQVGPVPVYRLSPAGPGQWKKWGLMLTSGPALIRLRRQYDLIFVSGFRLLGIPAVLAGKLFGKRCILKADSLGEMSGDFFAPGLARLRLQPSSWPFRLFLRLRNSILRQADAYDAISQIIAEEMAAQGIPVERIRHIPNSVDSSRFQPVNGHRRAELRRQFALPAGSRIVIFTGRLVSYKGLPLLLRVWREIQKRHQQTLLLLVGAGGQDIHNCEQQLKEYVHAHQLAGSVRFTGSVANVHEYLQAADLFVFPTENEAFGISLIEAMACGLAAIGTGIGGVVDILQHNRNGLVVSAGDFEQLLAALEILIDDNAARERLGRAALQTVQERYTATMVTRQYVNQFSTEWSGGT
jgi:glycosyltransferase involved in cell wall biosynthesis